MSNENRFQIGQCRQVFAEKKVRVAAWGFFNVDHTLIMMVNYLNPTQKACAPNKYDQFFRWSA
jgi:hypothetical protein